jgi:hypothetical protein
MEMSRKDEAGGKAKPVAAFVVVRRASRIPGRLRQLEWPKTSGFSANFAIRVGLRPIAATGMLKICIMPVNRHFTPDWPSDW